MAEPEPNTDYPIFLTEHNGVYELRIRELILVEHSRDLQKAYEHLTARKQEIIESARTLGTVDELPDANPSPCLRPLDPVRPRTQFEHLRSKLRRAVMRST